MTFAQRLVAGLACIAACQAAQADRSRLGDENDVIDAGDCELELAAGRSKSSDAVRERRSSIQVNCGIGWRTELEVAFDTTRSDAPRVEVVGVEAKTSLRDRGPGQIGWSLVYGVETERGAGQSWRRSGQFITLEATYEFDAAWLLEAKLGTTRDQASRSDSTVWAMAVERALSESVEARLELSGDDRQHPLWSAGLRYEIWPDHALVSVVYRARTGPIHERQVGLALTLEF